ncbi:MAG: hypothetical protein R3B90_09260 [Planctomycetaceae bacterium]
MIETGLFTEDDRFALLDGWLVEKITKGPGHEFGAGELADKVLELLPSGWHIRNQAPITLEHSEPEPYLTELRGEWSAACREYQVRMCGGKLQLL